MGVVDDVIERRTLSGVAPPAERRTRCRTWTREAQAGERDAPGIPPSCRWRLRLEEPHRCDDLRPRRQRHAGSTMLGQLGGRIPRRDISQPGADDAVTGDERPSPRPATPRLMMPTSTASAATARICGQALGPRRATVASALTPGPASAASPRPRDKPAGPHWRTSAPAAASAAAPPTAAATRVQLGAGPRITTRGRGAPAADVALQPSDAPATPVMRQSDDERSGSTRGPRAPGPA